MFQEAVDKLFFKSCCALGKATLAFEGIENSLAVFATQLPRASLAELPAGRLSVDARCVTTSRRSPAASEPAPSSTHSTFRVVEHLQSERLKECSEIIGELW